MTLDRRAAGILLHVTSLPGRHGNMAYLAGPSARELDGEVHWAAIRSLYASVARTMILPMQDVLGLDNEARMNRPGSAEGNWEWRLTRRDASAKLARTLRDHSETYGRLEPSPRARSGSPAPKPRECPPVGTEQDPR